MVVRTRPISEDTGQVDDRAMVMYYGCTPEDWEEASDEKRFVEYIDGRLIVHSPVSWPHARLFGLLHPLIVCFAQARNLGTVLTGPFAMELETERKFEPDIMFLAPQTQRNLTETRLVGPADVAIEIASPSTGAYDRGEKREYYRVGGVREYWMIDPRAKVVIVDRPAGREVFQSSVGKVESQLLPGFWLKAEWLWQDPLPPVADCLNEILAPAARH